jgi:predicted lipid-binding transport protein (Tim44 family)
LTRAEIGVPIALMISRSLASVLLAVSALLVNAPSAFAPAGGGSSGFSGGGGGGGFSGGGGSSGGGGFSGGGGTGVGGDPGIGFVVVVGLIVLFVLGVWIVALMRRAYRRADAASDDARFRFRQRRRGRDVELAAAEAAADDESFAVARVREDAELLFRAIQAAWSRNDIERLHELVAPELMKEWELRLKDFRRKGWRNKIEVKSVEAAYVGLVNRAADEDDRVVVRISARVRDIVVQKGGGAPITRTDSGGSEHVDLREWWTLGKRGGRWTLLSIEQREEGEHHVKSELVAAPEHDSRIADEAIVELAAADTVAEGFTVAEVADLDFDGPARDAAMDLALVDGRFAPDVLEAAARRAVAGWVEAIDGADDALAAVATPEALQQLLRPEGERTRLVVRGGRVLAVRITGLDAASDPARMSIEVDVAGRRYVENRDTVAVVSGSKDREVEFTERWTLALSGREDVPWRIVDAAAEAPPAAA